MATIWLGLKMLTIMNFCHIAEHEWVQKDMANAAYKNTYTFYQWVYKD